MDGLAQSQADEIKRQGERIRELIRERDRAKSDAEAAYDMAEQYARAAGVDVAEEDVLRYVEQYWEARGQYEREWSRLDDFAFSVFQIGDQLEQAPADHPGYELAQLVAKELRAINPNTGTKRSPGELFPRPKVKQCLGNPRHPRTRAVRLGWTGPGDTTQIVGWDGKIYRSDP